MWLKYAESYAVGIMQKGKRFLPQLEDVQYACIIHRAHYRTIVWEADIVAKPDLRHPTSYGWKVEENGSARVSTSEPPAPRLQ